MRRLLPGRRLPVGAELEPDGGASFRIWAPACQRMEIVVRSGSLSGRRFSLQPEGDGWFCGTLAQLSTGDLYQLRLEDGLEIPDPASRFQPEGPHGPSEIINPFAFAWTDSGWKGRELKGQVLYELHIGSFAGGWPQATERLQQLAELGVTTLELMPVAEFPGRFGWGYDGVDLFAPTRLYGRPDDMRRFVDRAHALGLGVILDVVYNHFGPDGNWLHRLAPAFFSRRHRSEWGDSPNYDDEGSENVRAFMLANVRHWMEEYHLDGLRIDATQSIFDDSRPHVVTEIGRVARQSARWPVLIIAENEPQDPDTVRSAEDGGQGLDAVWNDDFHHSAKVAATGRSEAYYSETRGSPQELVSATKRGFLYQGQLYTWQGKRRGGSTRGIPMMRLVSFLQNHDQVANSLQGLRLHQLADPGRVRALTALWLLGPQTPMLFQGQEFGSSSPFLYFADHEPELAEAVRRGRFGFLEQFPSVRSARRLLPAPEAEETFRRCRLDWSEWERNAQVVALHRDLLRLRREDPTISLHDARLLDGAVLGAEALCIRFFAEDPSRSAENDRLLILNLGRDEMLAPAPEPLLAAPRGCRWTLLWSSEDPCYGGLGTPPIETCTGWSLPGHTAVLLRPEEEPPEEAPRPEEKCRD